MTDALAPEDHVSIAPTLAGTRGRLLNLIMRSYFKRKAARLQFTDDDIAMARRRLERISEIGARADSAVRIDATSLGAQSVEIVEAGEPPSERPVILYLHGGGFMAGSPRTHRGITRYLARSVGARVVVPDYRLAPEHVFPTALHDAVDSYARLLESTPPSRVAIAGDSAGGNLTLSTLLEARERGLPMPAAAVTISPWADLTGSGESVRSMARKEAMLPANKLSDAARLYAGHVDLTLPTVSPVFGDYSGLPPLLVHVGTTEILLDDARRVVARARAAGVEAHLRLWRSLPHVFHVFSDYLPAARTALQEISDFMQRHLRSGETPAAGGR